MKPVVLLTRPEADSRALEAALAPIPCLIWPLTRIELVPAALPGAEALAFTSRHGVEGYVAAGGPRGLPAWCVGAATRAAAEAAGLGPCFDAGGTAEDLARALAGSGLARVLYPRGAEVSRPLAPAGVEVAEAVVYRAPEGGPPGAEVAAALGAGCAVLTIWSPRAGRIARRHLPAGCRAGVVAISAAAAAALGTPAPGTLTVAEAPTREAMLGAIRAQIAAMQHGAGKGIV